MLLFLLLLLLLLFCYNNSILLDLDDINDIKRYEINYKNDENPLTITNVQVEAIDSDYFSIYSNRSTLPGFFMGNGVYARRLILKNHIICEYRGTIIDNNSPHNNKNMMIKNNLYISGNNICSLINDCRKVLTSSKCYNGFNYNARAIVSGGKMFIISNRAILPNEEIFFNYDYLDLNYWDYWKDWNIHNEFTASNSVRMDYIDRFQYDENIENSYGDNNNQNIIEAVDSDYLSIYTSQSTIPVEGGGYGVFAKRYIPERVVICEYRGPIIDLDYTPNRRLPYNDKYFGFEFKNKEYMVLGKDVCSMINDCSNAIILLNNNGTLINEENDPSECYENLSYNARAVYIGSKIFIMSTRAVFPGEEIFFSYSWRYWKSNYLAVSNKSMQEITIFKKH